MGSLARIYETLGQPKQAEQMLTRLTQLQPKAFAYFLALGSFYDRQGDSVGARKAFKRANDLNPRVRRKMRPLPKSRDAP